MTALRLQGRPCASLRGLLPKKKVLLGPRKIPTFLVRGVSSSSANCKELHAWSRFASYRSREARKWHIFRPKAHLTARKGCTHSLWLLEQGFPKFHGLKHLCYL